MKPFACAALILAALLGACNVPRYVPVTEEYSPKVLFSPDSASVLIINQFDLSHAEKLNKRQLAVMKAGMLASVKYAQNQLKQLPHVKVLNLVDSIELTVNGDSVNTLALRYHAGHVLALQSFAAGIDQSNYQSSSVSYNSSVDVKYKLFESNGVYYKDLDGSVNELHSELPNMGLIGNLIMQPTLGGNRETIIKSAEHATQAALQDYLPLSILHNRPIYDDDWLQPAVKEIYAGNFEKADTLLQPFLKDKNMKIVSRAAYMLAIVYESEGDSNSAIGMAQHSADKFRNNYAEAMLKDLQAE